MRTGLGLKISEMFQTEKVSHISKAKGDKGNQAPRTGTLGWK